MLLSDIDSWNVGALHSIAFELGDELETVEGVASDLELISRLPGWESPAAAAARGKIHETGVRRHHTGGGDDADQSAGHGRGGVRAAQ
ncbi:hypothetical protein NIIDNTM18_50280 [Mycolicibacterium litorale]|uniref:Uncharacterized protein n=1 Tax=Mycolicibacterium litorale TaxID=758802 RepID=A0A6S6PGV7_9MYCO|nr:hypothetical protein [Mycolicibacterium litorale]BCI55750.1 hypothetical protein NIIDNTM18_50280 [Mycolicibacterium litorale]